MKKILTSLALVSAFALTGIAGVASAQTATDTTTVTPTYQPTSVDTTGTTDTSGSSTVGVPNTGAGGDAPMNYAILATSAAVAIAAAAYAFRKPQIR